MTYNPDSIDTTKVQLPDSLNSLVEQLAEHNHDIWAQERINQGWSYGEERNDSLKHHPDLIPYDELPESEKEFDRKSVVGILKAIVVLGYTIEK